LGNNRPIKKKDWINFLKSHDCHEKRHKGTSHVHWKCPNCFRTITFRNGYKEIPAMHLKSNLKSMGYNLKYLYDWLKKN
jgi:transposase-like protein